MMAQYPDFGKGTQVGDVVPIYYDPVTRKELEGNATLVNQYRPDVGDGLSMWDVEFVDDPGETYLRTIQAV